MNADIKRSRRGARLLFAGAALIVVAVFGLGGPSIALGASSSTSPGTSSAGDQYAKPAVTVAGISSSGGSNPPPANSAAGGALPFTGVSLIWPALAAVALVGLGISLRRYERKNS